MNGLRNSVSEATALAERIKTGPEITADAMICPPATLIRQFADQLAGEAVAVGAQDCHASVSGAHTGDLGAEMLADAGASAVIVGHSERRADHGEGDAAVRAKAEAVWRAGLVAIICVGETEDQRRAGETLSVIGGQIAGSVPPGATAANTIIAYEPVWAIGSGLTPTTDDIAEVHASLREELNKIAGEGEAQSTKLLYGGSVKPGNAAELMAVANVDGALVGGASLKAEDFYGILAAYGSG